MKTEIFVSRTNYVVLERFLTLQRRVSFICYTCAQLTYDMIKLKCNASLLAISYSFPMNVATKTLHIEFLD
jgi:hypothetical protein